MESKNKTVLMSIIDAILEKTVWYNKNGTAISLKDAIAKNAKSVNGIDYLDREDLVGAYTSCKNQKQSFTENIDSMSNKDLADKIKLFIFDETRECMLNLERELNIETTKKSVKTA